MEKIVIVDSLKKTFSLSNKQRKLEKTKSKVKVALDGLSFDIYKGEIYGLLGPNGAGKTTALRIISTLIKPNEGDVIVDSSSVKNNPDEVRNKIGFLTSELKLEDFFTPNYLFDFFASLHGIDEKVAAARKEMLFQKFGIEPFKEVKVADLSTGMKQKVSIAIAIVHDPDIIIFDEPTNGLDVITSKMVTDFLIDQKNLGKTILLSTHIFSLVEKICDRVGIIIDGKLMIEGEIKELTKEKNLEEVFFDVYSSCKGEENE